MNYRIMFLINALIAVLLGLAFLVMPSRVLGQLGVDGYAATKLISQFFGTAMLGLGLLLWFAKDVTDTNLQKGMGMALLVYAIPGLAYGYLLFQKPKQLVQS